MTKTPKLSLVIVTWNGKRYAIECLESLARLKLNFPLEVIVVDNASTDGTPAAIRGQFPGVRLIENSGNLGFAKANNIGIAASTGDFVALVNSDVVVPAGCLETMVGYLQENPTVGLLGPKMLSPAGGIGPSVMGLPTVWNTLCCALGLHSLFPKSEIFGGFLRPDFDYTRTADVEVITGWFWMTPRAALDQVGGLDERFFMYGEDVDWSHRYLKGGWRVVYLAEAAALHYGAASSAQAPTRFYIEMRRANLQYFRKHHGRVRTWGYILALWVHELARVGGYGLMYCFNRLKRAEAAFKVDRSVSCIKWLMGQGSLAAGR